MKIKGKFKKLLKLESGVSKAGKEWKKQSFILDKYIPHLHLFSKKDQIF